jgi:ATP/maltotriose-dependent transcriptional regulator MalT
LSQRLSRESRPRLPLISAPPGFGKTTLLSAWLATESADRPVAWVSLEESEREPGSFWTYVVTALDAAAPGLASDLDGPSIARELVVSLNTVRTHTKSIYAKLGVNSRRAAVTRAGELHLLGRSSR